MSKRMTEILYYSLLLLSVACFESRNRKENNPDSNGLAGTLDRDDAGKIENRDVQVDVDLNKEIIIVDSAIAGAPCEPNCPELEWVLVPEGSFEMGLSKNERTGREEQKPLHEVSLAKYAILKSEVTVSQYSQCVAAGVCSEPYEGPGGYNWNIQGRDLHPINGVDWDQAKVFAEWVGARLINEAEWEYAIRGAGRDVDWPWGTQSPSCDMVVTPIGICIAPSSTVEVCSTPMDNTPQGVCDMAGNVAEWVEDDYHENYQSAPQDGSAWVDTPRSASRVIRGAGWNLSSDYYIARNRLSWKVNQYDESLGMGIGFRLARSLP